MHGCPRDAVRHHSRSQIGPWAQSQVGRSTGSQESSCAAGSVNSTSHRLTLAVGLHRSLTSGGVRQGLRLSNAAANRTVLVTAKMRYESGNEPGIYSGADLLMLMRTACPSWLRCTTTLGARWCPTSWTIPSPCSSNAQFHGSRGMQPRPTLTNAMPLKASDNGVPVRPLTKVMPLRRCREPCECDLQGLQMDGLPTTSQESRALHACRACWWTASRLATMGFPLRLLSRALLRQRLPIWIRRSKWDERGPRCACM